MTSLKQTLSTHRLAVILAILTSIIVAFPQVYLRIDHKEVYKGIELISDSPWSGRVREIMDGHGFGSIYYKDGKDDPYLFQPLGSRAVASMGDIFSLDINNTILLSRIVLSVVVFLLMYYFILLYSRDKLAAASITALFLLADSLLNWSGISLLLQGLSPDNFLQISRTVNPAMVYIIFFGFLIAFWQFYRKRTRLSGVLSAIFLGLNFYNYFYSWTYLYAFGGFLVLIFLITKRWKDALQISCVFTGALVVAIPYVWNLYSASLYPTYELVGLRHGIIYSHAPIFVGLTTVAALTIYVFGFPKEDREKYFFGLALLLAPFVTMNQQIITGKVLQEDHYHWFFHKPMAVVFVLLIIFEFLRRRGLEFHRRSLASFIIALSLIMGIYVQADSYLHDHNEGGQIAVERQKYGPVMDWLNENAIKEEVVIANEETSRVVAIYTSLNNFYHRAAMYSLSATHERLLEVLFAFYRLRGVTREEAREVFLADRVFISWNIYGIHYRELLGAYEAIPDEKINEIADLYIKTLDMPRNQWIKQTLDKYEVNYLVWDKKADPLWLPDQYPFLEKMAEFGDMVIYRKI